MEVWQFLLACGIPSTITGLFAWYIKKYIDKRDAAYMEHEKNREEFIMILLENSKGTSILCEAIAKAVQRIPDAHCNGDMTSALEVMHKIQKEEDKFLMKHGIKHIFEE